MAFLTQNQNQFAQGPMLGSLDLLASPATISAKINPSSTAVLQNGSAVKLITGASHEILVDGVSGDTDGPVFGVITFNSRKNAYVPNDTVEVATVGSVVQLLSSAAVNRGAKVSSSAATVSADPLVTTNVTSGRYITGVALDQAAGASELIRVRIEPSVNP